MEQLDARDRRRKARAMRRDGNDMAVNWSGSATPSRYTLYSPRSRPQVLGGARLFGRRVGAVTSTPRTSALDRLNLRAREHRGPVGTPEGSSYAFQASKSSSSALTSIAAAKKLASRAADKRNLLKAVEYAYDAADRAAQTTYCGGQKCSGVGEKVQTMLYDYINAVDLTEYARGMYDTKYKAVVWAVSGVCVTAATGLHGLAASATLYAASWFWAKACPRGDATAAPADATVVQQLGRLRATRIGAAALNRLLKMNLLWALVILVGKALETRMQRVLGGLVDVPMLLEKLVKIPANRELLVDFVFGNASNLKPLLLAAASTVDVAVLRQLIQRYEGLGQAAIAHRVRATSPSPGATGTKELVRMRSRTPGR